MPVAHTNRCILVGALLVCACSDASSPIVTPPSPVPVVTMSAESSSDGQEEVAGYSLPLPLRVAIRVDGALVSGVVVTWSTSSGAVTPLTSVTNTDGIASAQWTLGPVVGPITATARISQPAAKTATFTATAIEEVNAVAVPSTQFQSAEVGSALPLPLQVRVTRNGEPRAGVLVRWDNGVFGASITETSVTDAEGIASAIWTMPTNPPGAAVARATVRGHRGGVLTFQGTALIGPPAQITMVEGIGQELPPYEDYFRPLSILVRDRFGNAVPWTPVAWVIEQGPVSFDERDDVTGPSGRSTAMVLAGPPTGVNAVVSAYAGTNVVARFLLTIAPAQDVVFLNTDRGVFVSGRNRSSPAVDTVTTGATVTWRMSVFDYDSHAIASVGTPALPGGGNFSYGSPSTVQVRFTEPGTYGYIDPYTGATGTVVVR